MICHKCGKDIPDESQYCKYCGAKQRDTDNTERKQVNKKAIITASSLIAIIAIGLIAYFTLNGKQPVAQEDRDSLSNESSQDASAYNRDNDVTEEQDTVDSEKLNSILESMNKHQKASVGKIQKEYKKIKDAGNPSIDYPKMIPVWYQKTQDVSEAFYSDLEDVCLTYYKSIVKEYDIDNTDIWEKAMSVCENRWETVMSDYEEEWESLYNSCEDLWDDVLEEKAWDQMYDMHDKAWDQLYDMHDKAWNQLYDMHDKVWDALYDGKKDIDAILKTNKSKNKDKNQETASGSNQNKDSEGTVFSPQDVSDATIESITTYEEYLTMYRKIIDDYFANYEKAIKDSPLYSAEEFQKIKDEINSEFEKQKKKYSSMKNQKLAGKEVLVDLLKNSRDTLKRITDSIK